MSSQPNFRRGTTGHRIAYIAAGPAKSKINLLCIHGWACQASDFTYLFTSLLKAQDLPFQVLSIDLPGHGKSHTKFYPRAGIEAFARAVQDFISDMELSNVVLMGHSMGVRVILETFLQSQQSQAGQSPISGLIFLDGSHYKFRKSVFNFDSGNEQSKLLSDDEKKEGMAEAFRTMFSPNTPTDFQESTIAHVKGMDLEYNSAMRQSFINYDYEHTDDALETVGKSGIPVLNVQATSVDEKNERVPLKAGEVSRWMRHVAERVPQVKQVVVLESSHFPHVDQPAEVAKAVRSL
jgi:pimeloyl-ACP methyl ester carboxylesterase